jgi:pimeloyl-ACP methyl ester carboxylesterase
MHHALNGFEVHLIDLVGFGFSGGTRCSDFSLEDSHENIGAMLQRFRDDKPAFLMGHSMGCLITQTFLLKNPNINLAGVIYGAPFFKMAKHA